MDFETTMAMIGDKNPTEFKLNTVSDADRARIDNALESVFQGLSLLNWLDGVKLGDAWRAALDTMRPIGLDMPDDNPAVIYLRHANFRHIKNWECKIIASRNSGDYIKCAQAQIPQWRDRGKSQVQAGMQIIQRTIAAFTPTVRTPQQTRTTNIHQREHTREREREREK